MYRAVLGDIIGSPYGFAKGSRSFSGALIPF